jgi:adenosine deaminase
MIPKAELHVHIEGTAAPELVRRKAAEKGLALPADLFRPDGEYNWRDFLEFLKRYDEASSVFTTEADYRDLAYDYLRRCAAEGAIYVEMMASADHGAMNGLAPEAMFAGIERGMEDAERDFNIVSRILSTCVRQFGVDSCEEAARITAGYVKSNPGTRITGFQMAGNENAGKPGDFRKAFAIAEAAGLASSAHAGEAAGPESIRGALVELPVTRIGHGVRAIEDAALVEELAERGVVLEVCPSSNICTGVYARFSDHPMRKLRDAGCKVTINSDDPPYFFTSLGKEYGLAKSEFGYTDAMLLEDTRTAIEAAFCDAAAKSALLARL